MASRLNLRFSAAPQQFLERTVLFTDELTSPEYLAMTRHRTTIHFDLQPMKERATTRVLAGLHLYSNDLPISGYFVPPVGSAMIPRGNTPHRFVFMPEFTCSRLMIRPDGDDCLRVECEQGLMSVVPPIEKDPDSVYVDSFSYWDHTYGDLVGRIRATAVLVKELDQPWVVMMQQIVGTPGFEQVRTFVTRPLRY